MSAFVYIVHEAENPAAVKVGWARDVKVRLVALQSGNPRKLVVAHTRECASNTEARGVERAIHHTLKDHRGTGEWFAVTAERAVSLLIEVTPISIVSVTRAERDPALARAIEVVGGASALARAVGVSREAVGQWERCPAERTRAVADATNGKVSPQELRPDLFLGMEAKSA